MKILGVVLIVLGVLGFAFGGLKFTHKETVADIGPVQIQKEQTEKFPLTPLASGALLLAGVVVLVIGARKR